jgi:hypothetical protein
MRMMEKTLEGVSTEKLKSYHLDGAGIGDHCLTYYYLKLDVDPILSEVQRLRDERDKNPGVWDGAPRNANYVDVIFYDRPNKYESGERLTTESYTRELPKTLAQEIAEKYAEKYISDDTLKAKDLFLEAFAEYEARKEGGK